MVLRRSLVTAHMIFFRVPKPDVLLWIDHIPMEGTRCRWRRSFPVLRSRTWHGAALVPLCSEPLTPTASSSYSNASTAAQAPSSSTGKLAQAAELFSGSVWHLLHSTGLFLSVWYRLFRKEMGGTRKQHESRKWGGKRGTPLPGY